ncbi:Ras subfamily protein [Acanthamoeba castellanii str. Neff]|uniref:Ras subfamily protein n=1 Tax=Acanthamoeba castellanii (strain ATCC 30010 / Neff) TaxID=1257118 RepID=L8HJW4_ACACF|nr:Ras subfamily protein [Acanthamoeba castellanii str. Neff]ELR25497.1 Ras subfamily protein [Acanthamoeba castellanii str. Neff]
MSKTNAGAASKKGGGKGKQQLLGEELLKVIMVGECGVGKSSLICKLVDNTFSDEPVTSLGMDFKLKTVSAEGKTLKLQIWGVVLVYDIADKESFKALDRWIEELDTYTSKETNKVIIGNKTDLGVKRAVAASLGKEFAEARGIPFFEVSAKSGENVDKVFVTLARDIHARTGEGACEADAGGSKVKLKNPAKPPKAKGGCSI